MKNKEITIYELIGLIKDDKAPKQIKIGNHNLHFNGDYAGIEDMYYSDYDTRWINVVDIKLNTKVEILPEENDEWEDIEGITLNGEDIGYDILEKWLDFTPNDNEQKICSCIETLGIVMNRLIKNQKYLKEKLEEK